MPQSKLALCTLLLVVVAACSSGSEREVSDASDPAFLPTGTYAQTIGAASCNVNPTFQSTVQTALFRNGAGQSLAVNIPVPFPSPRSADSLLGPREEIAFGPRHVALTHAGAVGCAEARATIDVTELTATRIAVTYRANDCDDQLLCSVDYTLDLVEAACARDCVSSGATLDVGADRALRWSCTCE